MKTTHPNSAFTPARARRASIPAAATSLLLAPWLFAQAPTTTVKDQATTDGHLPKSANEKLYSLKFDGGEAQDLNDALRKQLSAENVVMAGESLMRMRMPAFELRNVRLAEIARTIEFLGEGNLRVEVSENPGSGNVWLIGRKNTAEAAATVRMRSVPAPHLFADEKALGEIVVAAEDMEMQRLRIASVYGGVRGVFRGAAAKPLKSQKIFVITGDEEGVAGLESLIKAAEQRLVDSANANAAALSANGPKMRAFLAPHVFGQEQRWKSLLEAAEKMRANWADLNSELLKESGAESSPAFKSGLPWVNVDARERQKVFMLFGTEAGIAGMESLIQAAEKLALEEDAKLELEMEAIRAAKKAEEAAERAKSEKREQ